MVPNTYSYTKVYYKMLCIIIKRKIQITMERYYMLDVNFCKNRRLTIHYHYLIIVTIFIFSFRFLICNLQILKKTLRKHILIHFFRLYRVTTIKRATR